MTYTYFREDRKSDSYIEFTMLGSNKNKSDLYCYRTIWKSNLLPLYIQNRVVQIISWITYELGFLLYSVLHT